MRRLIRPSFLAAALVIAVLFVSAVSVFAALGGSFVSYNLNDAGCYVDVSAQVEDAGFYAINMWDDGNFRSGDGRFVEAGQTLTVRFYIGGLILQGASGIGVYLEDGIGLAATTTYDSDGNAQLWSDTVGTDCLNAGFTFSATALGGAACTYPLPAGSVVYPVPAGALAFYAADASAYTGFNLSPGTWYISQFSGDFAKVWVACEASPVWIPVANVVR